MLNLKISSGRLFTGVLAFSMVAVVLATGIAAHYLKWGTNFEAGTILSSPNSSLFLEPLDFTPEPGEIQKSDDLARFYERQVQIQSILSSDAIAIEKEGEVTSLSSKKMSFLELSALFWIQIIVGLGALVISGWIWSLKPQNLAAQLFALSGFSTLLFTFSSAIYTTRELSLPVQLFKFLAALNGFGASLFGVAVLALFCVYPLRFSKWKSIVWMESLFFGGWLFLYFLGVLPDTLNLNFLTLVEMIGICIALIGQFVLTRKNPTARASLTWLGLSVLLGAGGFIGLNALPLVLNTEATVPQGYAFLFFLLIYLGLALGISRYRLFDVGEWAFRFLFYSLGAVFLVVLDIALISFVGLERLPALGFSFFAVGILYLPIRDWAQKVLFKKAKKRPDEIIREVMYVTLAPTLDEKAARWKSSIQKLLQPLKIAETPHSTDEVMIKEDGVALYIPPVVNSRALFLRYPSSGKSLFSKDDVSLVRQVSLLLKQAESSRDSYERGVKEERLRIAQDLHDDVGARLLTGLHRPEANLRETIQETLSDIRSIVKGISGQSVPLSHLLADLRIESIERLSAVNIKSDWLPFEDKGIDPLLEYQTYKAITSSIREIISNVIKHSRATHLSAEIEILPQSMKFVFTDNGGGLSQQTHSNESHGNGLKNLTQRAEDLGGTIRLESSSSGTKVILLLPIY